ncbi:MAG: hypothetical protein HY561_01160 [Gemmatimonadetes bacterium]|nr:hypothetical protein [Gemmatimonadota bacterium]
MSFFDVLTDAAVNYFLSRGVSSRSSLIITRAERDADPLGCDSGGFGEGTLPNWVTLSPAAANGAR